MSSRAWVLPDEPVPVRLMNTIWADRANVFDELVDVADLDAWISATGVGGADVPSATVQDVRLARDLRDALRRLAAAVTEDDRPRAASGLDEDDAVRRVNASLGLLPRPALSRSEGGWRLDRSPARQVPQLLGTVAEAAAEMLADPATPLRACHAPGCVLYFVKDHPRREWCSTTCGNRARAARHYALHGRRTRAMD